MKKQLLLILTMLAFSCSLAWADSAFIVRQIKIEGLQRISASTVYSYLPVKQGDRLTAAETTRVIQALYRTGFFERISVARQKGVLIIHVTERATIGQLKISGNSVIPTDKLTTVMKNLDIEEGRTYNPAMIEKIRQGLLNQYYQLGRYNARVNVTVSAMSRNRKLVNITISEGLAAKIQRINIIGNHVFSENTLIKNLTISTPGLFTFFTQTDRYSEEKLEQSLEELRNYYYDHGYIKFKILSAQAGIAPDRKSVYVTVAIEEGELYKVKGYRLDGQFVLPRVELESKIHIKPGDTFSRQAVVDSEKAISDTLGDHGYVFAAMEVRPEVNDAKKEVFLVFTMRPGKRAYVRHISFSDNVRTNDEVLRREIQQLEAAPVSTSKLDDSKHRLILLPYIKDVQISVVPVKEIDDQVDVNYKVKEDSAAQATFSISYSQLYRFGLGAGVTQKNFLGTGKTLGVNFMRNPAQQYYGIDYTDPYYTPDGISRSFNISASRFNPGAVNVSSSYTTNEYNVGVLYGIPLGQEVGAINRMQLGGALQDTLVHLTSRSSNQVNNFVAQHGRHFRELDLKIGYSRDSRDKAIFPSLGAIQTLFADLYLPLSNQSLTFYSVNYHAKWYHPLVDNLFTIVARADLGYGNAFGGIEDYPFFRNYFTGGFDSVHGYLGNSLGPRDSTGNPFGGNMLVNGSLGLIFPNYISESLRTSVFVDGGNVYSSLNNRSLGGTASGAIRYSTGIEADWLSPLGTIGVSVAKPLNAQGGPWPTHDQVEPFQFSLGASLG
ncbi:MAG: outer membrane protein assembly factor BamA [Gammaproteobacteria bacterium RIFCSPHIGHO2_12_FULL_41_20]|nr:MAG: outer membrane protein assembly factor BamA [Gammaproteobacteria bacterium RIFCSPHIGHO2_12_FULL_41_20]